MGLDASLRLLLFYPCPSVVKIIVLVSAHWALVESFHQETSRKVVDPYSQSRVACHMDVVIHRGTCDCLNISISCISHLRQE